MLLQADARVRLGLVLRRLRVLEGEVAMTYRCARDSDWCDGVICRDYGIDCPNQDREPKCMVLDIDHGVQPIEQPESLYAEAREWKCERCGKSFSEPHPTSMRGTCVFDRSAS